MGFTEKQSYLRVQRAAMLVVAFAGSVASAQGSAVLTGTITDASTKQPVADAVVTATSPNLQGEQIVVSDASGTFRIPQLPPGNYTVRIEKEQYKPFSRGDIRMLTDATIRFNPELLPDTLTSEQIVVVGRAPTIDVGSSTTGVNVGSDFVNHIAVVAPGSKGGASRSFESLAETAPGANADTYGVSVNGTTSPENQFVIDGLSVNDPAFGILGTPLTIDFIQEVNVITGGYMPEYGRATGGIMNVVTKSGSNEFHGSVFANWSPGALDGARHPIAREGTSIRGEFRNWNLGDFGGELGGPILKDKLWFYIGVAPSFTRLLLTRSLEAIELDASGEPVVDPSTGFTRTLPLTGGYSQRFADQRTFQFIAKLTYLLNSDNSLTLSFYGAPTTSGGKGTYALNPQTGLPETIAQQGAYESLATIRNSDSRDLALKYATGFLDKKVLIDATLGWHHQVNERLPSDGSKIGDSSGLAARPGVAWRRGPSTQNAFGYHSLLDFESIERPEECAEADPNAAVRCPIQTYASNGPGFLSSGELDRYQGKLVATYLLNALGHHVWKAGIDIELMSYNNTKAYSGNNLYRESAIGTNFADYRQYGYLTGPDQGVVQPYQQAQSNSTTTGGFLQDSWNVADVVTLNAGVRYDQQTIFGADGAVGMALNNQWSPRVGLIYDFTQEGRSKIFANYARFYEGVPLNIADRAFPGERQFTHARRRAAVPATGAPGCNPLVDPNQTTNECLDERNYLVTGNPTTPSQKTYTAGGDRVPIDPNLKPQSSDEIVAGAEYAVVTDGRLGVQYTKRWMNDVIEDMSRDEASTYFIGNPGSGIASDFPKAVRDYDAVNVYFNKAFSDLWLAQLSYTYANLRGNYAGLFRPETGQLDPNINADFDLISLLANRTGPLPSDRTHSIKAFAAKEFILSGATSLNLGLSFRTRSGDPISYLGSHPIYGTDEVFVLPRGAAGRLPWVSVVDTRIGFTYKITKDNAVTLSADLFNLFNFQAATVVDDRFTNSDVRPFTADQKKSAQEQICIAGTGCASPLLHTDGSAFTEAEINPNFKNPLQYQAPRTVRFGAKVTF